MELPRIPAAPASCPTLAPPPPEITDSMRLHGRLHGGYMLVTSDPSFVSFLSNPSVPAEITGNRVLLTVAEQGSAPQV